MDQKLKNYSSGMQVRLAFSIAIRAKSDILLLDEVLAVGDAAFQQKCFNYFEKLKAENRTVVFVSHDMGAVRRFCTRAIYIRDGVLVHDGTPTEVSDIYNLDNIEGMRDAPEQETDHKLPSGYKITTKILKQTDSKLEVSIQYESKTDDELYVAFSLIRDGASIAELTTPPELKLAGSGAVIYELDTAKLNAGVYELPIILCKRSNREMLSIARNKNRFVVKGGDLTRGAAMRLEHTWRVS
jgi:ABC-2 type transport system ATP-binding protein